MSEIQLKIAGVQNYKLLTEPWPVVARKVLYPKSLNKWLLDVKELAIGLGEINVNYSKVLPDNYLKLLWKRQTELRRIVSYVLKRKPNLNLKANQLEQWFTGKKDILHIKINWGVK